MSLQSISLNTQDAIQVTIGSKYPYYTRNSAVKYRTMQIGAVISVQLDPTATFLEFSDIDKNGVQEKSYSYKWSTRTFKNEIVTTENREVYTKTGIEVDKEKVLDDTDIKISKDNQISRQRIGEPNKSSIDSLDNRGYYTKSKEFTTDEYHVPEWGTEPIGTQATWRPDDYSLESKPIIARIPKENLDPVSKFSLNKVGPFTLYEKNFDYQDYREYTSERTPDMLLLERKYREKVMDWLTDGKPKLFRSATEGNMIVVLTNVSFTPFDKSERMVYSFSATATEVAEYNLENLLLYGLVPVLLTSSPWSDPNTDYRPNAKGAKDPRVESLTQKEVNESYGKRKF